VTRWPSAVPFVPLQNFFQQDLLRGSYMKQATLGFHSKKKLHLFEGKTNSVCVRLRKAEKVQTSGESHLSLWQPKSYPKE